MNIKLLSGYGLREVAISVEKRHSFTLVSAILWPLICVASASAVPPMDKHYYLPDSAASKIVSVAKTGNAAAEVIVLTEAVAIKETGPRQTVAKFGEVYAFSPTFIAVRARCRRR